METPEYLEGDDAALVLFYGSADQAIVSGINEITLPEYTSSTIEAKEFRKTTVKFASQKSYGDINFSGNLVATDESGQRALAAAWDAKTKMQDCRAYLNNTADGQAHFMTVDLANDPNSCFQVIKCSPGKVGVGAISDFSGAMSVGGAIAYFVKHYREPATPVTAFTVGGTITAVPATVGVRAGDTLIVEGSTSNDGFYLVESVSGTTVTLTDTAFTAESGITGMDLHFGRL